MTARECLNRINQDRIKLMQEINTLIGQKNLLAKEYEKKTDEYENVWALILNHGPDYNMADFENTNPESDTTE